MTGRSARAARQFARWNRQATVPKPSAIGKEKTDG
jgi:hypothetical protein